MRKIALLLVVVGLVGIGVAGYFLFTAKTAPEKSVLKVHFLSVGQGDAILIEAPNGGQMLIDGGRPDNRVLGELAAVMKPFDKKIDVVVATHPDADHIGGLSEVLKRYEVELFLSSQADKDTSVSKGLYDAYEGSNAKGYYARRSMRITLDAKENIIAEILFPDRDTSGWEANSASSVIKLTYKDQTFLFTGDAEQGAEAFLVKTIPEIIDVDVLKLGHHGSKTSSTVAFLKATTPELAIISVGKNSYGHPAPEVTDRLRSFSIPWLSTQNEGTITLITDGTALAVQK